ncbi:MAG: hypothetical protein QF535_00915, partial [Anaerolineales bacterium]|nr:hypothetical protein [Anaerolineales bacterium]
MSIVLRSILLLCVLWLSGCGYVRTTNPIVDGSTPVDERLIGTWWHANTDGFAVLNIQKKDKNTNELAVILLAADGECDVFEARVVQVSDYWIFEFDVDLGTYSCVAPHESLMGPEIRDEYALKELGNRYEHVAYKILKWNDPTITNLIEQDNEEISDANEFVGSIIKNFQLEDPPTVLLATTLVPNLFAEQIKAGKLKGSIAES